MRTLLAVLALVCASSTPALAQPEPAPLVSDTAPAVAPIALSPAEIAALVKAAQAGATAAPAAQPAKAPAISEAGVFGLGWGTIGGILGMILAAIFAFWKGAAASRVQKALPDLMDAAYWFVERNFGDLPGPQKFNLALGELYKGMTGHGFVLDTKAVASAEAAAKTRWSLLAETHKVPAPVPPAQLAGAQAAAAVAATPGTATDLANAAAK